MGERLIEVSEETHEEITVRARRRGLTIEQYLADCLLPAEKYLHNFLRRKSVDLRRMKIVPEDCLIRFRLPKHSYDRLNRWIERKQEFSVQRGKEPLVFLLNESELEGSTRDR